MRRFAALALLAPLLLGACAGLPGSTVPASTDPASTDPASTDAASTDAVPSSPAGATSGASADTADPELDAFLAALTGQAPTDPASLVDAIEAAGFPRSSIERTRELDSLGAPVTFLEIAVLTSDGCIIGQVGDGEPMAVRASPLGGGRCLVGEIVSLD